MSWFQKTKHMPSISKLRSVVSNAMILDEDLIQVHNLIQELENKARKACEQESEIWNNYQRSHLKIVDQIVHQMQYCETKNDFKMRMKKDELIFFLQVLPHDERQSAKKWILENGGYSKLIFVPENENLDSLFEV